MQIDVYYLSGYLILINIITFIVIGLDKYYAIHNKWRIKENTLFLLFIIGGSVGGFIGMNVFRHKTKKPVFIYGDIFIMAIQFLILSYLLNL